MQAHKVRDETETPAKSRFNVDEFPAHPAYCVSAAVRGTTNEDHMDRIDSALLLLRVVFGVFLACHGVNKVKNGINGTAGWFSSIGMRWPGAQAVIAATSEIVAGALFALGLATPVAAAVVIALMIVAIVTVHWRVGFFIFLPNGGWEYCASIAAVAVALSISGPGRFSLDEALGWTHCTLTGIIAVALGVLAAAAHLALTYRPKDPA